MTELTPTRAAFGRPGPLFLLAVVFFFAAAGHTRATDFDLTTPTCITVDFHPAVQDASDPYYLLDNYRMSRNPNTAMAFDTSGTLHLTYWSGFFATNPNSPAAVYYQSWNESAGWSENQIVDQSYIDTSDSTYGGKRMGGRHPSLCVDNDDTVWIAWHDHRDCGVPPPYNGINNIEIYCDKKPVGEDSFSNNDIRLTYTSANHMGDNGYCARIQADPVTNKKTVMWYDFTVDGWISDIFMITSDANGTFDTSGGILSYRLTNSDNREATGDQTLKPAFNMPDFVITPGGERFVIWSQDFGGSIGNGGDAPIYFAQIAEQPEIAVYSTIVSNNDGYWFPPKLKQAPNGDLWVIYTAYPATGRQVEAIRYRDGVLDAPVVLADNGRCENGDMAIDSEGHLHVVWIKDNGTGNHLVQYLLYDPETDERLREEQLTEESGAYAQPCIVLDKDQRPCIVYCEGDTDNVGAQGDIWFVRALPPPAAARNWNLYE